MWQELSFGATLYENNHEFDFNNVKVLDRCPLWLRRLFSEARHPICEPNSINDHIHIPDIYKMLD